VTDDPRAGGVLGRISGSAPGPDPEKTALASPVDVLLSSADSVLREKMAGVLRRSAHTVVEVDCAAAAAGAVREGCAPRILVLDLEGVSRADRSAFASLRQTPGCVGALVLSRVDNDEAPGLSPEVSLLKPVDATELVEAVRRLCGTLGA
jgi:DNA-binding NarL/FixJ family response regulator